jgi:hypothetical protein
MRTVCIIRFALDIFDSDINYAVSTWGYPVGKNSNVCVGLERTKQKLLGTRFENLPIHELLQTIHFVRDQQFANKRRI